MCTSTCPPSRSCNLLGILRKKPRVTHNFTYCRPLLASFAISYGRIYRSGTQVVGVNSQVEAWRSSETRNLMERNDQKVYILHNINTRLCLPLTLAHSPSLFVCVFMPCYLYTLRSLRPKNGGCLKNISNRKSFLLHSLHLSFQTCMYNSAMSPRLEFAPD